MFLLENMEGTRLIPIQNRKKNEIKTKFQRWKKSSPISSYKQASQMFHSNI